MGSTTFCATRTCAVPPWPASAGSAVLGWTLAQIRFAATTIPCGLPPTSIVFTRLPVMWSIRVTVPSPLPATQTEPSPIATPVGARPTGTVAVTARVVGSMRTTASSRVSATQTPSAPTAMPLGPWPTGIGVCSPVGSILVTVLASLSVTHTAPAPTATAVGPAFGSTC